MMTFDEVDKLLSYDPDTGFLTWKADRNQSTAAGSVAGYLNKFGYIRVKVCGDLDYAHKIAWLLHTGKWPSNNLDHIDGCTTNNRFENLRECTQAENLQNKTRYRNNKSGIVGVYFDKARSKWRAQIQVNGKQIHLGRFITIEEAAAARAAAKAQYHQFQPTDRS